MKEDRSFVLKIVFIVIIGLSITTFIFTYRRAKDEVLNHQSNSENVGSSVVKVEKTPSALGGERLRVPQNKGKKVLPSQEKRLIPSRRDRPFDRQRAQSRNAQQMDSGLLFQDDLFKVQGQTYSQVANAFATTKENRDLYSPDDIMGERDNFIFVKGQRDEGSYPLLYNHRSKRLGVLTGQLIITFIDRQAFDRREANLSENESEVSKHPGALISVISFEDEQVGLGKLEERKTFWEGQPGIKAVKIEVLESQRLLK